MYREITMKETINLWNACREVEKIALSTDNIICAPTKFGEKNFEKY